MSRGNISIGKISGISIGLDYSWFFIFILITWSLARSYYPSVFPEWSTITSVIAGIVTSLLFFASVLAHELMHSITAQRSGIPVKSITLFIFGGLAQISREPEKPGTEFKIAIAGPLTNFILGIIFWAIWYLLPSQFEVIAEITFWLGWINFSLALFNLLPGFPLDGGRVLRAIIWRLSGNPDRATKLVTYTGKAIAYLIILIGVILILMGQWFNGIWLAFIGWFLSSFASSNSRRISIQQVLQNHNVAGIMKSDCFKIPSDNSIDSMYNDYIKPYRKHCLIVTSGNRTLGLVNMRSIRTLSRNQWPVKTAIDVMTPLSELKRVSPEDNLATALRIFQEEKTEQLPVTGNNEIIGILNYSDLANFINKMDK
ncbi:MAG: site-2 protease family protein [Dehalococcoidales bacterium]|nr:site-2 protease family protein [Dehalococcoidales bacterium]